jgi:hypothetical protein
MIVHYLNVKGIGLNPAEADPPLAAVDPNAVLARPFAGEGLQPIPGDQSQIGNGCRRMNVIELPFRHHGDTLKLPTELAPEDLLGFLVPERPDQDS